MGRTRTIEDSALLAAAREVFRTVGYSATTRDVARAAGISQAVLYQRFATKDELFFQAMRPEPFDVAAVLGPYPPADPCKDLIAIATRLHAHMRAFMPTMLKVLAAPVETERLQAWHAQLPFPAVVFGLAERLRTMASDGLIRAGDHHATAIAFLSMLHSFVLFEDLSLADVRKHRKSSLKDLVRVLWAGLAPEPT
jgi:AcrR family transcriptional regulator